MIRVLSVDDHALLREGIAALVGNQSDMELVAEACNGREAVELFRTHRPDVTLMDLQMPEMGGIDALSAIRGEFPEARIIVLTTYTGDIQVMRAMKAGARAYLLKGLLRKELIETIRAVHAGQRRMAPEIAAEIAEHATDDTLTVREIDVLRLIAGGNANKEIAALLSITEETVKGYVKNILAKLQRQRPDPRRHHRTEARGHRSVSRRPPRKRGLSRGFFGVPRAVRVPYHRGGASSATLIFNFSRWLAGDRPSTAARWRGNSPRLFWYRRRGRIGRSAAEYGSAYRCGRRRTASAPWLVDACCRDRSCHR